MDALDLMIHEGADGVTTIKATGPIDLSTAPRLRAAFRSLDGNGTVMLDMSGVTFLDSTGLTALVVARRDRAVLVVDPSEPVRQILEMTSLDQVLGLAPRTSQL